MDRIHKFNKAKNPSNPSIDRIHMINVIRTNTGSESLFD